MNIFIVGLLIGAGLSLVVLPIFMGIFLKIRETLKRREIKRMLKNKQFIEPIDEKDYDSKMWNDINKEENRRILNTFNRKIFYDFDKVEMLKKWITKARSQGLEDKKIIEMLKESKWKEAQINLAIEELKNTVIL